MFLCDNISPLSKSMTRVEKYRRYRNEISNMKFETFTTKREAAMQIDKLHNSNLGRKLNYDQVMSVHEVYDDKEVKLKKRRFLYLTKYELLYCLIASIIILTLVVAIILVGIHVGGK